MLLLIEYFELKITEKMTYHFPKKILGGRYLAGLQQTYENLTKNLGKILRKSYEVSKIGPQDFESEPDLPWHSQRALIHSVRPILDAYY